MSFPKKMIYQNIGMEWIFYKQYRLKQEALDDEVNKNFTTKIVKDEQNGKTVYGIYKLSRQDGF